MKNHLIINVIISIFCYMLVSISQKTFDIANFSDGAAFALSSLIFMLNAVYYVSKYLDGEFSTLDEAKIISKGNYSEHEK